MVSNRVTYRAYRPARQRWRPMPGYAARVLQSAVRAYMSRRSSAPNRGQYWKRKYAAFKKDRAAFAKRIGPRPSVRKPMYHGRVRGTLASGGLYAGKFRKFRKAKYNLGYGVKTRTESNGEVSAGGADEVIWIGASAITPNTVGPQMLLACLRKLAKKNGHDFRSEHDYIEKTLAVALGNTGFLVYQLAFNDAASVTERAIAVTSAMTWGGLASAWWSDIISLFSGASRAKFHACWIDFHTRDTTSLAVNSAARLDMRQLLIDFDMRSVLKLQNRTGANTGTEVDAENIEQNPIVGRCFKVDGSLLEFNWNNDNAVTPTFVPNVSTGILTIDPEDASYTDGFKNMLIRPPTQNILRYVKGTKIVRLQPGHIKSNVVSDRGTMYFDTMFAELLGYYAGGGTIALNTMKLGCIQLFCFEKTLRTGTGTAVVKVGYEHNQYHHFGVREKKQLPYIMEHNVA